MEKSGRAQKILDQHKVVIVGYQNDTNSNDATVKSYLSMFADYNLSYYVDRIEHYYSEFSSAGIWLMHVMVNMFFI